jgi:hypothetical protein
MPLAAFSLKYAAEATIAYRAVRDSYTGYGYEDQASVQKLLGKDPALADKNEVIQSSSKGARSASLEVYADSLAIRDAFVALLFKKVLHNDGVEAADHTVVVMSAKPRIWVWAGGLPLWIVAFNFRETV